MDHLALLERARAQALSIYEAAANDAAPDFDELVKAIAISEFLGDALVTDKAILSRLAAPTFLDPAPAMRQLLDAGCTENEFSTQLRRTRHAVMADIAWRDLTARFSLEQTLTAVSDFADLSIQTAVAFAERAIAARYGHVVDSTGLPQPLVVIGMGKLGGRELNFSSDVDLIFLYPEAADSNGRVSLDAPDYFRRIGQTVIRLLDAATVDGFVFRVDMRLRPFGDSGPLVVSFAALEDYLQTHGRDWERYAWVKARAITGISHYEGLFRDAIRPFVYRRYLDFGVFESLREMKTMISREVARRELDDDVKLGAGGIREVEFIAQAYQLLRGGSDPSLQTPSLLSVLPRLLHQKQLAPDVVADLDVAYRYLRRVENRLQMMADQQTHRLPTDPVMQLRLAMSMDVSSYSDLRSDLDKYRTMVRGHFADLIQGGQHVRAAGYDLAALWAPTATEESLAQALREQGVREADAQSVLLLEWIRSSYYRRLDESGARRLARLLPLVVEGVNRQPSATATLRRVLNILQAIGGRTAYLALLHESDLACRRLIEVCGLGDFLPAQIASHPLLLDELVDQRLFDFMPSRAQFSDDLRLRVSDALEPDSEREAETLRVFQRAAVFRIALLDLTGRLPLMQVSDRLTDIAELLLERVIALAWRDLTAIYGEPQCTDGQGLRVCGIAVIGYGKLGGFELGYSSDLDLVFLHDSEGEFQQTSGPKVVENGIFYLRLGQKILNLLTMHGPAGRLYEVDTRLRPSGKGGPLVSNVVAFEQYQCKEAWTWEHQALLHSRVVAGSAHLAQQFAQARLRVLCEHVDVATLRDEVRDMRARMRKETGNADARIFDIKRDAGGLADIEFLAQYWVLKFARRYPALVTFADTIRQLESVGSAALVDHQHIDTLIDAYRDYRSIAHRLSLEGQPACVTADDLQPTREAVRSLWETYILSAQEPD